MTATEDDAFDDGGTTHFQQVSTTMEDDGGTEVCFFFLFYFPMTIPTPIFNDSHPRVRYAACLCVSSILIQSFSVSFDF